jgi:phosphoesterase RecJ-like protein
MAEVIGRRRASVGNSRPFPGDDLDHAREIERSLAGVARVIVTAHVRPDGDAVGSCLALASILRARGVEPCVVLEGEVPRQYAFLRGAGQVERPPGAAELPDTVLVALDSTSPERLGRAAALARSCARTVVIDHHVSNTSFGDANWVDTGASSVGEMIHRLARALGWDVPEEAAEPLYVAIVTDTGRFSYSNTTSESLRIAGELVAVGVDPARVAGLVYGNRTRGEWDLDARARASLRLESGGRIAMLGVTARDFEETGTKAASTQDLPALTRTLAGVEIGLFFYEVDGGRQTRVNIRTAEKVDANVLASRFGGGGHQRAAGCTLDGDIGEVRRKILAEARGFLKR